jgi:hypothetical protein
MSASLALLIRPHDFLVDTVQAWMRELQLTPVPFESLKDFTQYQPAQVGCLVISSAASSRVKATLREAVEAGLRFAPRAPLIFPSLVPLERMRAGLALELKGLSLQVEGPDGKAQWGSSGLVLHVSPTWLEPSKRVELNRVTRLHLGLPVT